MQHLIQNIETQIMVEPRIVFTPVREDRDGRLGPHLASLLAELRLTVIICPPPPACSQFPLTPAVTLECSQNKSFLSRSQTESLIASGN